MALLARQTILPGLWSLTYHAPAIATGARAGQTVHARVTDGSGLAVRLPFPIHTADAATGSLSILVGVGDPILDRLAAEDGVELLGPFGRPFEVDPRSHHLLIVTEGRGVAAVRMLVDEAVRDGRAATLLLGAGSALDVYPSALLPDELEYVVATADGSLGHAGRVVDLVPDYEAWADQAFAAGSPTLLAELSRLAAGRRARLGVASLGRKRGGGRVDPPGSAAARRKAFLQVAVQQDVACALGTCLGCVVAGADGGLLRACREGPVFAAEELAP
jgi:dihydroorotate dehydrogenase electron transfer subunit